MLSMHGGGVLDRMDLNLLWVLQVLLEERSVTRAAARLGRTQPAVSRSLAKLRQIFGDPLFVRVGTQLVLTPRAEAVTAPLEQVLRDLQARVLTLDPFEPAHSQRTFVIATADYTAAPLLTRLVQGLGQEAPGVQLQLVPALDKAELVEQVDLVIAPRPQSGPYRSRPLFVDPFLCILRKDHPIKHLDLASYVTLRHLLIAPTGVPGGVVDEALASLGLSRTVAVQVHSFSVAPGLVASTDLVCTLPRSVALRGAEQHALQLLPPPVQLAPIRVPLSWHERWQHDAGHSWLRGRIVEAAEGL
jgi:DNA-binding transcriptional LysR family regulator